MSDTYEEIYSRMKQTYETQRGDSIDEASDIAIRLRTLAGEIYNMQSSLEWTKRQFFAATATGESLDYLAQQRGLERKPARKSHGSLTFRLAEAKNYAVAIPAGTVVATDTEVPLRFVTTVDGEIPQATLSASIPAEAADSRLRSTPEDRLRSVRRIRPAGITPLQPVRPLPDVYPREAKTGSRFRPLFPATREEADNPATPSRSV